jgi:hypothetical protein
VLIDDPVPISATMRHGEWHGDAYYLQGHITTGGKPGSYKSIRVPAGREVMVALGADRELEFLESAPGKAAEQLIRAAGPNLSMLASPGVVAALDNLTRGRSVSLVRRRLNEFLAEPALDEASDRYQILFDRLNKAIGVPDSEEVGYPTFDQLKSLLRVSRPAAQQWINWALSGGLLLQGVEAKCTTCGQKQWRPLSESFPSLSCHGCGRTIRNPHELNQIGYRYRTSEILLRAMSHDVLPCVLAMRYVSSVLRKESVYGAYPGVEFREPGSPRVEAEADVLVVLRNGALIVGECKTSARGLRDDTLENLWKAADRVGARATFVATLDRAANCGADWQIREAPGGRPHFALTAEHLYDLECIGPLLQQDVFEWRTDYGDGAPWAGGGTGEGSRESSVDSAFSDYVERTGKDYEQHYRAPWMRSPED